jgi:hypothetical protein
MGHCEIRPASRQLRVGYYHSNVMQTYRHILLRSTNCWSIARISPIFQSQRSNLAVLPEEEGAVLVVVGYSVPNQTHLRPTLPREGE